MAHHGNTPFNPEQNEVLKQFQKALQGEFPQGRLNREDEGAMAMSIGHENGKVVIQFARNLNWIGFSPDQAIDLAQSLIQHARKCGSTKPLTVHIG